MQQQSSPRIKNCKLLSADIEGPIAASMHLRPWQLRRARAVIQHGGIVAYPTEAVFGLGCDPLNRFAVERLLALKQRSMEKGLILIAADYSQLEPFIGELPEARLKQVLATWPGPHTWLFPVSAQTPYWLSGAHDTLAVRVTRHPLVTALCRYSGTALVSTSANISGHPPAYTSLKVQQTLGSEVDYILHGDTSGLKKPTPIRDGVTGRAIRY